MPTFSAELEESIHVSLSEANLRRHEFAGLEHLLLALIEEPDASRVMQACAVDLVKLRARLLEFLEEDLRNVSSEENESEAVPTAEFQRVIQRAAIQVQTSGRTEVTGGRVLVAMFSERDSAAAQFLNEQEMTRYDAVNFISHGVAKDPAFSETIISPEVEEEEVEEEEAIEELLTEAEWRAKFGREFLPELKKPITGNPPEALPDTPFLFVSYSNKDRDFARGLLNHIEGWDLPFWWDQHIEPGTEWRSQIAEKLENATVILTLWTKNSTASKAVIEEASMAQAKRKLVHVRLDSSAIPYGFAETQYVDLRDWDGSESHPNFRRMLYAIQDKLALSTVSSATARLRESSPVEAVAQNGRLVLKDAPANASAAIVNPVDLETRLAGLRQTTSSMISMCANNAVFQLPPALHYCLEAIESAATISPVTWYALEDAKTMLHDCMIENYAEESWNTVVFNGLTKLSSRIDEVRPLLQPVQIDPKTNAARPPVPEPVITEKDIEEVISLTEKANSELSSEEGQAVIDENTAHLMESALNQMYELKDTRDELKLFKFRRGLKNATYIIGSLVTAIGTGVVVNLLTAPSAAQTLFLRLKPIFENFLQFFL